MVTEGCVSNNHHVIRNNITSALTNHSLCMALLPDLRCWKILHASIHHFKSECSLCCHVSGVNSPSPLAGPPVLCRKHPVSAGQPAWRRAAWPARAHMKKSKCDYSGAQRISQVSITVSQKQTGVHISTYHGDHASFLILPQSYCKFFQHRMCGVPTCNSLTAGDKLQKHANDLKHGRWSCFFPKWKNQ